MAQHIATAAVVKVSIGSTSGNRVAAFVQRGGVVPEGVAEEQLKRLVDRGLIAEVIVEVIEPEAIVPLESDAGAKAKPEKVAAIAAAAKK